MARIGFVGDVYPGSEEALTFDPGVLDRLHSVDLLVANLESPLTARLEPQVAKGTHLRSDPDGTGVLTEMGVGVASLANNHMFDFGVEGFRDTVAHLDASGIEWVGAGDDLAAARRPRLLEVAGMRIGFVAYSSPAIETVCATDHSPGCAPIDIDAMVHDVAAIRDRADVVTVLLHWGLMGYELPTALQRDIAQGLADAGADLVIGSHPHVLQGIRAAATGLVAYSLGDFAFHPRTASGRAVNQYRARQTGALLTVEVGGEDRMWHELFLTRQVGSRVGVEASPRRFRTVRRISAMVAGPDEGYLAVWKRYVLRRTVTRTLKRLAPWKWRTIRPGTVRGLGVALRELFRSSDKGRET